MILCVIKFIRIAEGSLLMVRRRVIKTLNIKAYVAQNEIKVYTLYFVNKIPQVYLFYKFTLNLINKCSNRKIYAVFFIF